MNFTRKKMRHSAYFPKYVNMSFSKLGQVGFFLNIFMFIMFKTKRR